MNFLFLLLAFIVLTMIIYFWSRSKMDVMMGMMRERFEKIARLVPPAQIQLEPETQIAWQDGEKVAEFASFLESKEFIEIGFFTIDELPQDKLWTWAKTEVSMYAIIYESSSRICTDILIPENREVTYSANNIADLQQLYQHALNEYPQSTKPVSRDQFISLFEQLYADKMRQILAKGMPSEEEFWALAEKEGINDESVIAEAYLIYENQIKEVLDE